MARQPRPTGNCTIPELRDPCTTILANIRFSSIENQVKTIVVTSASKSEGKSTTAANLASTIAASGKTVLLMECDMRKRTLASMLALSPKYGLYALLSGSASVRQSVVSGPVPGMYFLDAEAGIPNPPDLLNAERFAALVGGLRSMYDYVIIDTPPVGMFVDAALVASVTDGVLFCLREHATKKNIVANALHQLETSGARILGLVMTFANVERSDYRYYSKDDKRSKRVAPVDGDRAVMADTLEGDLDIWASEAGLNVDAVHASVRTWSKKSSDRRSDETWFGKHSRR